jgi:hypothetical protein
VRTQCSASYQAQINSFHEKPHKKPSRQVAPELFTSKDNMRGRKLHPSRSATKFCSEKGVAQRISKMEENGI